MQEPRIAIVRAGPRSKAAAEKSAQGLEICFALDAPKGLVHFFESMGVPREN